MEVELDLVEMYTDGACKGNPGPGGWGVLLRQGTTERELSGGELLTTNNRMELLAVIEGLSALRRPCEIDVWMDSQYVRQGITQWIHGWKKKGWKTANREPVKNVDLWLLLDSEIQRHDVEWFWVKGHSGHPENERCDELARNAALAADSRLIDSGYPS